MKKALLTFLLISMGTAQVSAEYISLAEREKIEVEKKKRDYNRKSTLRRMPIVACQVAFMGVLAQGVIKEKLGFCVVGGIGSFLSAQSYAWVALAQDGMGKVEELSMRNR